MKMTTIIDELYKIGKENNFTILFASEVSSRAHGFHAPDSDFDVKFIYMKPEKEYLRVERDSKDVININTTLAEQEVEFTGWEITKFLSLMYKGNVSTFEWFDSPYIYIYDDKFRDLVGLGISSYFIPFKAICTYRNLASDIWTEARLSKDVTIKKYLHTINFILNARMTNSDVPGLVRPCLNIKKKLYLINDAKIVREILKLIEMRKEGIENIEHIPVLHNYIENSLAHLSVVIQKWEGKKDSYVKYERIDEIFYKLLKGELNEKTISC